MGALTRGRRGAVRVRVERSGTSLDLATERRPGAESNVGGGSTNDLPGPAFRRLSPEVAYLKLSAVKTAEIPDYP